MLPDRLRRLLTSPVDIAGLVFFRIAFGLLMICEVYRYAGTQRAAALFIHPKYHFSYYGFDWIPGVPSHLVYPLFYFLAFLAGCIALGWCYRISCLLFGVLFTYLFLLDQTRYLNHHYLLSMLSFLMAIVPANRQWSLDVRRNPKLRTDSLPRWTVLILQTQIFIVYFYGGIAKINSDWLHGEPMRLWLSESTHYPLIGRYFTWEPMVYSFVYGGLLFDLAIVPLLLWRPTRLLAWMGVIFFHLSNAYLFPIGIFPWFMLAATTLFFDSSWPRHVFAAFAREPRPEPLRLANCLAFTLPSGWLACLLIVHFSVQLLVPFRHHMYPGDASWTEEGHLFAWRMKLRDKRGTLQFRVTDSLTGESWNCLPHRYLAPHQATFMTYSPDVIWQHAQQIAQEFRIAGYPQVEVRALSSVSFNQRPSQPLIAPNVDLTRVPRPFGPAPWIMPLKSIDQQDDELFVDLDPAQSPLRTPTRSGPPHPPLLE